MVEPNAFYCVLNPEEVLPPSVEAVKHHGRAGALWLRPGAPFSQAVKSIQDYAQLPSSSEFAYLSDFFRWIKIREAHFSKVVEPGVTYCFRIRARQAASSSKRQKRGPDLLGKLPLHAIFDYATLYSVQRSAFQHFMAKGSTQEMCKQMVSSLSIISSTREVQRRKELCKDFHDRFCIAVDFGKDWWKILPSSAGLLLDESNTFFAVLSIKPGSDGYIQSGRLPLSDQEGCSLKELALLQWLSRLLRIKPLVKLGEELTLSSSIKVRVAEHLNAGEPASNTVLRVSDGNRNLVLKIGHSAEALTLLEDLCLESTAFDQVVKEGKILERLGGCRSVPHLVFSGQWEDKPVVLTELQGLSLEMWAGGLALEDDALESLCNDLTGAVIDLQSRGVAHGDITPRNVGVYSRPEEHGGRQFYLFDFGFAVELDEQGSGVAKAVSPLFSSADTISSQLVSLATELISVVYVCLYMAGVPLPWKELVCWGPSIASVPRQDFAEALKDGKVPLDSVTPALRNWIVFVLTQLRPDAAAAEVEEAARTILHSKSNKCLE